MDTVQTTLRAAQDFLPAIVNSLAANPWVLLIALTLFGIWMIVRNLLSHPIVVDAVAKRINDTETSDAVKAIFSTVEQIRRDQVQSNLERREQAICIKEIIVRLDDLEHDVGEIRQGKYCTKQ